MADSKPLVGKRVLIFVEDQYEDLELWYPRLRLIEAGAAVVVAGPEAGREYHSKHGYPCRSDVASANVNPDEYDGLVIPGGYAPDRMRRDKHMVELVRRFVAGSKVVAFICHAGWVPISAGVLNGIHVTGYHSIKDDLVNAGANYEDESVVVDGRFVSSRQPDDLPDFCEAIIRLLSS